MKKFFKSLAVAAAMVIAFGAQANVTAAPGDYLVADAATGHRFQFTDGQGTLSLSNGSELPGGAPVAYVDGLVGLLNVIGVDVQGLAGAGVLQRDVQTLEDPLMRGIVMADFPASSISLNETSGSIETLGLAGGIRLAAPQMRGMIQGGELSISNLRIDLSNKAVLADLEAVPNVLPEGGHDWVAGTETISRKDVVFWNIDAISGPTELPATALAALADNDFSHLNQLGYSLPGLQADLNDAPVYFVNGKTLFDGLTITNEGLSFMAVALGIPRGVIYDALWMLNQSARGWGSLTTDVNFISTVVPEPATSALMGLGLLGIVVVARRRR